MITRIWAVVVIVVFALLGSLAGCSGRESPPTENLGERNQATTGAPDPAGTPGAGCERFVEQLPNGNVRFAVKFPHPQLYVEVFVKQNGVQNIAQNIVSSGVLNPDGSYTYSLVKPASQYHAGDTIQARFYSYRPGRPGVFTPGPAETVWLPTVTYGQVSCPIESSACHDYVTTLANGDLRFSVTLPDLQHYVEVFVKQNGVQNIAQNIVSSRVSNGNGTATYSLVRPASQYQPGDIILTRFYSYKSGQPGVFTPGPQQTVWAPEYVVGSLCRQPVGGPCGSDAGCQSALACVVGTCRDCSAGGCGGSPCSSNSQCVSGLVCASGECRPLCSTHPTAPGCVSQQCTNGVKDGGETDVDCGGPCPNCGIGGGCSADADCEVGMACGINNGACFGTARAERVCWPAQCQDGVMPDECGHDSSPCGKNCGCVVPCVAGDPSSACPDGEVCKAGLGALYLSSSPDVCVDPICPSNDPALCGDSSDLCGQCLCTPNCSSATCQNPSDGCKGHCPNVCDDGEVGCTHDLHCQPGSTCLVGPDGVNVCRPGGCAFRKLEPPLCGSPGAQCGEQCPICTPQCDGRQCGADPNCGTSCGTCPDGTFCDALGQCAPSTTTEPPILVPDGSGGEVELEGLPPSATSSVGTLNGFFSVSDQGTSEYNVPITVPPGRAGMEPVLSLRYSGARVNAEAGVGWRLEGLSSITRCPRTYALDGYSAPIKNDPSDLFCIDGKRLEAVSGAYGGHGTHYRTLIESFARIESFSDGGAGFQHYPVPGITPVERHLQGPDYFRVWTKDGRIVTYGRTRDSLVFGRDGVRHTWLVNRIEDRSGNTILYTYDNAVAVMPDLLAERAASLVRPITIAYAGHGNQAGNREVRFEYEDRQDQQLKFRQGGLASATFSRLKRITTLINGAPVNNYRLEYGPGLLSQINEIYECVNGDDTTCKRPTKFEYVQESGFTASLDGYGIESGGQLDVNGDGVPDFFETTVKVHGVPADPALTAAAIGTDIAIGVASSFATAGVGLAVSVVWSVVKGPFWGAFAKQPTVEFKDHLRVGNTDRFEQAQAVTNIQGMPCSGGAPTFFLDYDQDGNDDIVRICAPGQLFVARSAGNGHFVPYPSPSTPVVQYTVDGILISPLTPGGSAWEPGPDVILYDINGDSLQDIVSCRDQYQLEVRLRLGPTQGFSTSPIVKTYPPPTQEQLLTREDQKGQTLCGESRPTHNIIDLDGDGAPELLVRDREGWKALRYSVTNGVAAIDWAPAEFPDVGYSYGGAGLNVSDLNGDGLADISSISGNSATFWINTGAGRFLTRHLAHPTPILDIEPNYWLAKVAAVDYDADGRIDFVENWSHTQLAGVHRNYVVKPSPLLSLLTAQQAQELMFEINDNMVDYPFRKVGDLDGDGNQDLFGVGSVVFYGSGVNNTLLRRIEDGVGSVTLVTYDTADTYTHSCTGNNYPESCLRRMRGLVSGTLEGFVDANGMQVLERSTSYRYHNARMNVAGHGWLGFEQRTVSDNTAGRSTRTDYLPPQRYDLNGQPTQATVPPYLYPLAGMVHRVTIDDSPGNPSLVSLPPGLDDGTFGRRVQSTNTWQVGKSDQNRLFPRLTRRQRSEYARPRPVGLGAPPVPFEIHGMLRFECSDGFGYDVYGNVVYADEACNRRAELVYEETVTETEFAIDSSQWLISNPKHVKVTSSFFRDSIVSQEQEAVLTYDNLGRLESVIRDPNGSWHKTVYTRNAFGNVELAFETAGTETSRSTTFIYDAEQYFVNSVINAKGHTTQLRFDRRWGKPTEVVDPNGVANLASYDGYGHLAEVRGPDGITSFSRENLPLLPVETEVGGIHPRLRVRTVQQGWLGSSGGSSVQDFDYRGRLVRTETLGFGGVPVTTEQAYDAQGRVVGATLPHVSGAAVVPTVGYRYDYLDRLVRVDNFDGTHTEVLHGNVATLADTYAHLLSNVPCWDDMIYCAADVEVLVDEVGKRHAIVKDAFGRVIRSVDGENIATAGRTSDYEYGPFGRLVKSTQNGVQGPRFGYDAYGRMLSFVDPDVGEFSYTYNGYDELKTQRDRLGRLRTFQYDPIGRLETIVDDAGTTQWFYDSGPGGIGQVSETLSPPTAQNPSGQSVRYHYEPATPQFNRGLLERVEYRIDGRDYLVEASYDDLARTREIRYPTRGSGAPIVARSSYDPASGMLTRVDEIGSGTVKPVWQLYSAFQGYLIATEAFGNGAVSSYSYDPERRWLTGIHTSLAAESIQSIDYAHYPNGQVLERVSTHAAFDYTYDPLARLSTVTTTRPGSGSGTSQYTYDAVGNLTHRGGRVIEFSITQPHLVARVGNTTYQYDSNGNMSARVGPDAPGGTQTLDYTPFNLPHTVTTGSGANARVTRFDYTADALRVVRRDATTARHFAGDHYQHLLASTGDTLEERFRLFAGERLVGEVVRDSSGDKTLYFHADHLGSTDVVSDSTGAAFQQEYDPWGSPFDLDIIDKSRAGFTGHQHDQDLGLIDMRGRVYDTLAARFTAADPIIQAPYFSQGLNPYAYVFNDPINLTDPSGHMTTGETSLTIGLFSAGWGTVGYGFVSNAGAINLSGLFSNVSSSSVGAGALGGAGNALTTALSPPGAAKPGYTATLPAPTTAPRYNAGGGQTPKNAIGESGGGLGPPPSMPRQSLFDPEAGALACGPATQLCIRLAQAASNTPAGQAAQRAVQKYGPQVANWARTQGSNAAAAASRLADKAAALVRGAPRGAAAKALDPNKLHHIFGKGGHNLGPLVQKLGSQEATFNAVQGATQAAVKSQGLTGVFETTVSVAGQNVVVRGNVMDGVARIGTFFIP